MDSSNQDGPTVADAQINATYTACGAAGITPHYRALPCKYSDMIDSLKQNSTTFHCQLFLWRQFRTYISNTLIPT